MGLKLQGKGFRLDIKVQRVTKALGDAMRIMATQSQNHFVGSFRNQGFTDDSLRAWPNRKRGTRRDRQTQQSRAILVQTGALRRSILKSPMGRLTWRIFSELPYSAIHNYGLKGKAFGKHTFQMPQRQFIGISNKLIRRNIVTLRSMINKAMTA
mgnify:CR=1 FL=1